MPNHEAEAIRDDNSVPQPVFDSAMFRKNLILSGTPCSALFGHLLYSRDHHLCTIQRGRCYHAARASSRCLGGVDRYWYGDCRDQNLPC